MLALRSNSNSDFHLSETNKKIIFCSKEWNQENGKNPIKHTLFIPYTFDPFIFYPTEKIFVLCIEEKRDDFLEYDKCLLSFIECINDFEELKRWSTTQKWPKKKYFATKSPIYLVSFAILSLSQGAIPLMRESLRQVCATQISWRAKIYFGNV